jgi:succinyl-CoA synthetase alpha subunit
VEGGKGTAEGKMKALREVRVHVVEKPEQIGPTLKKVMNRYRGGSE